MKSFQQKRGFRNIMYSKPVLLFLGILLLFFVWGVVSFSSKMRVTAENKKIAENKVIELERQKKELSAETAKLKTVSGIEESIREKFSVAKEGEGVIVVVEEKNEPKVINKPSKGFFSFLFFWKNWFK